MRTRTFTVEVSSDEEVLIDIDKLVLELLRATYAVLTTTNQTADFNVKIDEIE